VVAAQHPRCNFLCSKIIEILSIATDSRGTRAFDRQPIAGFGRMCPVGAAAQLGGKGGGGGGRKQHKMKINRDTHTPVAFLAQQSCQCKVDKGRLVSSVRAAAGSTGTALDPARSRISTGAGGPSSGWAGVWLRGPARPGVAKGTFVDTSTKKPRSWVIGRDPFDGRGDFLAKDLYKIA